jgi:hypothetical protein
VAEASLSSVRIAYRGPVLKRLSAHDEALSACSRAPTAALSAMDLLGVVQSSIDELGFPHRDLVELKLKVLEEVSAGRLVDAVHMAILQAAALAGDAAATAARDIDRGPFRI